MKTSARSDGKDPLSVVEQRTRLVTDETALATTAAIDDASINDDWDDDPGRRLRLRILAK